MYGRMFGESTTYPWWPIRVLLYLLTLKKLQSQIYRNRSAQFLDGFAPVSTLASVFSLRNFAMESIELPDRLIKRLMEPFSCLMFMSLTVLASA